MEIDVEAVAALVAAAQIAGEGGSASAALRAAGITMPNAEQLSEFETPFGALLGTRELDQPLIEAICLGYLAGSTAPGRHRTQHDVTTFLMDEDLVVRAAAGESILRLPWFEQEMFVGRQLPDAIEIPTTIRNLAVDSYRHALTGTATQYTFVSYGHRFSVDAVPVHDEHGRTPLVIAIATPGRTVCSVASATARRADQLIQAAQEAEARAEELSAQGHPRPAAVAAQQARTARRTAGRLRQHAERLIAQIAPPQLSERELEVLTLAAEGCSYAEIAEQLVIAPATVKTHLSHCYEKLEVPDKASAVAVALRHGLID